MRVAIVGAGVSGLVSARVFRAVGLDVVVFEARSDVGGVWSASRRYPGLGTQNDKATYSFSDHPMPADYPEYPSSAQVQAYLAGYATRHGLDEVVHLDTTVRSATPVPDRVGWSIEVDGPDGTRREQADWLVLGNGMYSLPHVPDLPGRAEFEAAGGVVRHTSELGDAEICRGRDVVVLGWGKSAADIAVASLGHARAVTMVARRIAWKLPRKVGRLTFQQLILSRVGEWVVWAPWRRHLVTRIGLKPLAPFRRSLAARLERAITRQQDLERRGLRPTGSIKDFTHLDTRGFFEAVDAGAISLHRSHGIASLGARDGRPTARLTDGTEVFCDVLVAATGFDQDLSVLGEAEQAALLDGDGDLRLYRHTFTAGLPRIAFVGWHNSFRSPLGAEVQAMWVAALIQGTVRLPSPHRREQRISVYRLQHARAEARGVAPFVGAGQSIADMDAWMDEAGLRVPRRQRLRELLRPVDPAAYAGLLDQLTRRTAAGAGTGGPGQPVTRRRTLRAVDSSPAGASEDSATT